jgi:hypothetical protein
LRGIRGGYRARVITGGQDVAEFLGGQRGELFSTNVGTHVALDYIWIYHN